MVKLMEIVEAVQKQYGLKPVRSEGGPKLHFINFETWEQIKITKCGVAVEVNKEVLSQGIAEKAEVLIVHHELFASQVNLMIQGVRRQMLRAMMRHGMRVYVVGEGIKSAEKGLSDALVAELGWTDGIVKTFGINKIPMGRIVQVPEIPRQEVVEKIQQVLKPGGIQQVKGEAQTVTKLLIWPGTLERETLQQVLPEQIDGIITGEFSYQTARLAGEENITLLGIGHIRSEAPGMRNLAMELAMKFRDTKIEYMPTVGQIMLI